jgi:hypothetical protein
MSERTLRTIPTFYEYDGRFAVPKEYAANVGKAGGAALSRALGGNVIFEPPKGIRIPGDDPVLEAAALRVPNVPHNLILTKRAIRSNNDRIVAGVTITGRLPSSNLIVKSSMIIHARNSIADPAGVGVIRTAIHEGAHSFGLREHCECSDCIMQPNASVSDSYVIDKDPFCDNCSEELETLGYVALSQTMSNTNPKSEPIAKDYFSKS